MPERHNQSGMTLVEILVAMVMMGIIITGIYNLFRVHNLMAAKQEETTMMQQELLTSLVIISDDLRMCGYTPLNQDKIFGMKESGTNGTDTTETSVYCTRGGTSEESATVHIAYRRNNQNQILLYNSENDTWEIAASNISNLIFTYFDEDETIVASPVNASTISNIRMIEINATAIPSPERSALGITSRNMHTRVWLRNLDF
ncbi:prepilin-type N-terminal cleavage/methylation domain-containing protein [Desulfomicrobium apsheronum]|uniref:Prepilin-type N-terminal cleavage/methylation domain-containing protein n=1 Tax=Desulfomicrobium apsheronum TaxID=52560 RepID=A0A1I3NV02_9BACT|nr:prepilin-type N-terminal cleavage/methylation domain-containing protein [Desulfomicrobium apsheronum]SFJ13084.1 prepilin-type N-terminal cleavage/methylation domain-containing protein [Desulfomicrobium apsheronum]